MAEEIKKWNRSQISFNVTMKRVPDSQSLTRRHGHGPEGQPGVGTALNDLERSFVLFERFCDGCADCE